MNLFLVRHALAESREQFAKTGKEDHLRPLNSKGIRRMQKICLQLTPHLPSLDLIVTSPHRRALQTAEIIGKHLKHRRIVECPELAPNCSPSLFLRWLRSQNQDCQSILAVGHEPQLGLFASYALTGREHNFFDLKKSGIISLKIPSWTHLKEGQAQLLYSLPPKLFF